MVVPEHSVFFLGTSQKMHANTRLEGTRNPRQLAEIGCDTKTACDMVRSRDATPPLSRVAFPHACGAVAHSDRAQLNIVAEKRCTV